MTCRTQAAAAAELGVTRRCLCSWLAAGCPGEPGRYDVDAIQAWRSAHVQARNGSSALSEAKAKTEMERARKLRMQADQLASDLVDVGAVQAALSELASRLSARLAELPAECGTGLDGDQGRRLERVVGVRVVALQREVQSWTVGSGE